MKRYIANNYSDQFKHDCINLILNRHACQKPYGIQNQIHLAMEK